MVGLLQALPGTQWYRRLEREGRLISDANGNNIDCNLSFVPRMSAQRVLEEFGAFSAVITTARFVFLALLFNIATANSADIDGTEEKMGPCAAGLFLGTLESKRDLV